MEGAAVDAAGGAAGRPRLGGGFDLARRPRVGSAAERGAVCQRRMRRPARGTRSSRPAPSLALLAGALAGGSGNRLVRVPLAPLVSVHTGAQRPRAGGRGPGGTGGLV